MIKGGVRISGVVLYVLLCSWDSVLIIKLIIGLSSFQVCHYNNIGVLYPCPLEGITIAYVYLISFAIAVDECVYV